MTIEYKDYMIPIITAAALCLGFVLKKWMPTDDKWIPTILLVFGAVSGLIVCGLNYEGIVKGMVSGLAAVGLHQAFKQHMKLDDSEKLQSSFNSDGLDSMLEGADYETENETAEK